MDRSIEQQLSEFLDDELPTEEHELLLRRLDPEGGHRATLWRYALIGEVMRGDVADCARLGFARRVSQAVAAEQRHGMPPASGHAQSVAGWKYAGFGLAAGIAAVAAVLLTGGDPAGSGAEPPRPLAAQLAPSPVVDDFDAKRLPRSRLAPSRLTAYLVSHGDYSRGLSRQIMNSHVVNQRAELLQASYQQGAARD